MYFKQVQLHKNLAITCILVTDVNRFGAYIQATLSRLSHVASSTLWCQDLETQEPRHRSVSPNTLLNTRVTLGLSRPILDP